MIETNNQSAAAAAAAATASSESKSTPLTADQCRAQLSMLPVLSSALLHASTAATATTAADTTATESTAAHNAIVRANQIRSRSIRSSLMRVQQHAVAARHSLDSLPRRDMSIEQLRAELDMLNKQLLIKRQHSVNSKQAMQT